MDDIIMDNRLKPLREQALHKAAGHAGHDPNEDILGLVHEILKARAASGLTQAQLAQRIGTTQSSIARLETLSGGHSPSLATLQKYARGLGCKLQIQLVRIRQGN